MTIETGNATTLAGAVEQIDDMLRASELAGDALESVVTGFGSYDGVPPEVSLEDDGRSIKLLKPMTYHQASGNDWPVPVDSWADGASIPRAFWTLIGGPLEGKYRNASIVHDRYCVTKDRPWHDVHRMFYEGMRCSGVPKGKAGVMFYAVYRFGPRWPDPVGDAVEGVTIAADPHQVDHDALVQDAQKIMAENLDPDAIEALAKSRDRRQTRPM